MLGVYTYKLSSRYLVHAGLVEPHDGGVGQPVKHGAQGLLGVQLLGLKQLFQKLLVEHGGDDVIHHCTMRQRELARGYPEALAVAVASKQAGGALGSRGPRKQQPWDLPATRPCYITHTDHGG